MIWFELCSTSKLVTSVYINLSSFMISTVAVSIYGTCLTSNLQPSHFVLHGLCWHYKILLKPEATEYHLIVYSKPVMRQMVNIAIKGLYLCVFCFNFIQGGHGKVHGITQNNFYKHRLLALFIILFGKTTTIFLPTNTNSFCSIFYYRTHGFRS